MTAKLHKRYSDTLPLLPRLDFAIHHTNVKLVITYSLTMILVHSVVVLQQYLKVLQLLQSLAREIDHKTHLLGHCDGSIHLP